jgi:hypothetical protein
MPGAISVGAIPDSVLGSVVADQWNPGGLGTSLLAWYAADRIPGISTGADVGTWADQSSNGFNATQASTGLVPLAEYINVAGFAGWVVISDGVDDVLVTADIGPQNIGSLCVIGGNFGGGAGAAAVATIDLGAAGDLRIMTLFNNDVTIYAGDGGDVWGSSNTIWVNSTQAAVLVASDTYQVIVQKAADAEASTGSLHLFRATTNGYLLGSVAELIFLNSTMTTGEQTLLQNYARDKYGITI